MCESSRATRTLCSGKVLGYLGLSSSYFNCPITHPVNSKFAVATEAETPSCSVKVLLENRFETAGATRAFNRRDFVYPIFETPADEDIPLTVSVQVEMVVARSARWHS